MKSPTDQIASVLRRPETVIFAGAGVSAWSGLPSWTFLLGRLIEELDSLGRASELVRRELAAGDLLQAASFGFDQLSKNERRAFLREEMQVDTAVPSALHRALARLPVSCFVTTNYDQLLESSLRENSNEHVRVVANSDLLEIANLLEARATNFVFKPHGDVDSGESIILTREDYRSLQGDRRGVMEALRVLFVSRPVVFIGYGLKDPPFLLLKDVLAETFAGGATDHYALMPEVHPDERAWWRSNYGVHLVSYGAVKTADGGLDHRPLLDLVERWTRDPSEQEVAVDAESHSAAAVLAKLQHAGRVGLLAEQSRVVSDVLPVRATPRPSTAVVNADVDAFRLFARFDAVEALARQESHVVLTGPPGAGKSYAVRAAVKKLADEVLQACLSDGIDASPRIPVYLDLKAYSGNLRLDMAAQLGAGLDLEQLAKSGLLAVFFDGVNELSPRFLEDNAFQHDLVAVLAELSSCSVVLVSRFGLEVADLELPRVELDDLPERFVHERLGEAISLSSEMVRVLRRPLFLRLAEAEIEQDCAFHSPHELYAGLVARTEDSLRSQFGPGLELYRLFGKIAFDHQTAGTQFIDASTVLGALSLRADGSQPADVLNWLINQRILIPAGARQLAFFHQSIQEYLAAQWLAALYTEDSTALDTALRNRRWDNSVLLCLGYLTERESDFFDRVMETDVVLAIRGVAYLDAEQEKYARRVLDFVVELDQEARGDFWHLARALERLPLVPGMEPRLWEVGALGDRLGGEAVALAIGLGGGVEARRRAIETLFERPSDYNYADAVARRIAAQIDSEDVEFILDKLNVPGFADLSDEDLEADNENAYVGLTHGLSLLLVMHGDAVLAYATPIGDCTPIVREIVLNLAHHVSAPEMIGVAAGALSLAPHRAIVSLYFQLRHREPEAEWLVQLVPEEHGPAIAAQVAGGDHWALGVLRELASRTAGWRVWAGRWAEGLEPGVLRASARVASGNDQAGLNELVELLDHGCDWTQQPVKLFSGWSERIWHDSPSVLERLLRHRDTALARALLEMFGGPGASPQIGVSDIEWWIQWLEESTGGDQDFWFRSRLAPVVARAMDPATRARLLAKFGTPGWSSNAIVHDWLLPSLPDLTLDELGSEGLEWILKRIERRNGLGFGTSPLGAAATEEFAEEVLVPALASEVDPRRREGIARVLIEAGRRHGRRYVPDNYDLDD